MRAHSQLTVLAFLLEMVIAANADPRPGPPPALPGGVSVPTIPLPAVRPYPPSWYYNPYTQGIVALPQRGGD